MTKHKLHIIFLFSLLSLFLVPENIQAQVGTAETATYLETPIEKKTFSKESWNTATQGLDYSKKLSKKKKKRDRTNNRNNNNNNNNNRRRNRDSNFNPFNFEEGSADFFRLLFVLIAIGGGAFVLYKVMGGKVILSNKRVRNQASNFNIEELDEETIKETQLDRFLREALQKGDYRLAVRIYYLEVLKQLTIGNFIKFKRDKTNREYTNEMRPSEHYNLFREITLAFDRAWYGEINVSADDYKKISPKFQSLIKAVQH